jgi:hypothetical protein
VLNKSYYTTINKVNYWEQKQIVALLDFALKNVEGKTIKNDLIKSLESVNFFEIQIKLNDSIIVDKRLQKYELDPTSTNVYSVNNYTIHITKRKYYSFLDDYIHYIKTLLTQPKYLFDHRSIVIFLAHLNVLLLLELILIVVSVKYRLKKLTKSINSQTF